MRLTKADDLFPQGNICQGKRITGRRMSFAIVGRVDRCERIVIRKYLIEPRGSEVFTNRLQRIGEGFSDSARRSCGSQQFSAVGNGPQGEEGLDAWHCAGARCVVGDKRKIAQSQVLAQAFVVSEHKGFVFAQRTAQRTAKVVALVFGDVAVGRGQARPAGDWAASLIKLLGMAFRDVDTDQERAKASIAKALSLLRVQIAPSMRDATGPKPGSLQTERDLTDYALASETLREAQADLAQADRIATIGRLTASVAHEVKQPIATMVIHAQTARRFLDHRTVDLQEVREALDCIVKHGYRVVDVINRIHDLVKKAPPKKERVEINEAINDVLELTRGEAVKNGVLVMTEFAERLPALQADRVQLQQVILNLIINAIEAMSSMREGARELIISTKKAESGYVLVAVRDSGPGLAPGALKHAFEASYTTKPSGLGLGLWICRSIIEAHGGRLWATANRDRGAIFQFTLSSAEKKLVNSSEAAHQTGELHKDTALDASDRLAFQVDNRLAQSQPRQPHDLLDVESLSVREGDILKLIAEGLSNKEIARKLAIAPETVKSHVKHIFTKLNVLKRAQAVSCAQSLRRRVPLRLNSFAIDMLPA